MVVMLCVCVICKMGTWSCTGEQRALAVSHYYAEGGATGIWYSAGVCMCVCNGYLGKHLQLSAEMRNTSRSRYFMKNKLNRFVIEGFFIVFEHVICSPRRPLRAFRLPSETKLSTAVYITTKALSVIRQLVTP